MATCFRNAHCQLGSARWLEDGPPGHRLATGRIFPQPSPRPGASRLWVVWYERQERAKAPGLGPPGGRVPREGQLIKALGSAGLLPLWGSG